VKALVTDIEYSDAKAITEGLLNDDALAEYNKNMRALFVEYVGQFTQLDQLNTTIQSVLQQMK
jgi:hypothetical protein